MKQNKQEEKKMKGVFSEAERSILGTLSRNVEGLQRAIDNLAEVVMNLTMRIKES